MIPTIFAPIKINLNLHVGPPQTDGYHPVDTVCVFPMIGDVLSYDPEAKPGIDFGGQFGGALSGEGASNNLIWRAFRLLDLEPQGRFFLQKETPIASGVGAGTADGVAAMLLLNAVLELGFDADQLRRRSLGLGADGPICMAAQLYGGGLIRARGIGERIDHLGRTEPLAMVVANPGRAVSTGAVFRQFDRAAPDALAPSQLSYPLRAQRVMAENRNSLAPIAMGLEPSIEPLLSVMKEQSGSLQAGMSGSGATCFALHSSLASAEGAARRLQGMGMWAAASTILTG